MTNTTSKETETQYFKCYQLGEHETVVRVSDYAKLQERLLTATKRNAELEAVVNRPVGKIQRFDIIRYEGMEESDNGDYVWYDDHLAAMRGREVTTGQEWMLSQGNTLIQRATNAMAMIGWKPVPLAATDVMVPGYANVGYAKQLYRDMIILAPTPPGGTKDERNMPTHPGQYRDDPFKYPEDK